MVLVGADGVRGGWVVAVADGEASLSVRVFGSFAALIAAWPGEAVRVAIDIPIGLSEDGGARDVDRAMRSRLTGRASSVFNAPARFLLPVAAVGDATVQWAEVQRLLAAHRSRRPGVTVPGISRQTLGILPKVAEVDAALRVEAALRSRVAECHPELSFVTMHGGEPLEGPKSSARGLLQRLELVRREVGDVDRALVASRDAGSVPLADVLDACAALWTARRWASGAAEMLGSGRLDGAGVPVRVVI